MQTIATIYNTINNTYLPYMTFTDGKKNKEN